MDEVIHECLTRNRLRVLMAYVDVNAPDDSMYFAESVAVSRAFPVRVFSSVAAAEKWLLLEHERARTGVAG
jgi:hypothetical protein